MLHCSDYITDLVVVKNCCLILELVVDRLVQDFV